jgi:hypothetical protein
VSNRRFADGAAAHSQPIGASAVERLGRLLLTADRRFPPDDCRRLRRGVPAWAMERRLESGAAWLAIGAFFLAGLLGFLQLFAAGATARTSGNFGLIGWVVCFAGIGGLAAATVLAGNLAQELVWWRGARRALECTRCRWCRAPLSHTGACLPHVMCPACGRPNLYGPAIRTVAQIIEWDRRVNPPPRPRTPTTCACGYPLAGLPRTGMVVTCPECGAGYPALQRPGA